MMVECIRHDRGCAAICWLAVAYMSRGSQFAAELCRICAEVCEACGAECRYHNADHLSAVRGSLLQVCRSMPTFGGGK